MQDVCVYWTSVFSIKLNSRYIVRQEPVAGLIWVRRVSIYLPYSCHSYKKYRPRQTTGFWLGTGCLRLKLAKTTWKNVGSQCGYRLFCSSIFLIQATSAIFTNRFNVWNTGFGPVHVTPTHTNSGKTWPSEAVWDMYTFQTRVYLLQALLRLQLSGTRTVPRNGARTLNIWRSITTCLPVQMEGTQGTSNLEAHNVESVESVFLRSNTFDLERTCLYAITSQRSRAFTTPSAFNASGVQVRRARNVWLQSIDMFAEYIFRT